MNQLACKLDWNSIDFWDQNSCYYLPCLSNKCSHMHRIYILKSIQNTPWKSSESLLFRKLNYLIPNLCKTWHFIWNFLFLALLIPMLSLKRRSQHPVSLIHLLYPLLHLAFIRLRLLRDFLKVIIALKALLLLGLLISQLEFYLLLLFLYQ